MNMYVSRKLLITSLFMLFPLVSFANAYHWIRSNVNEFWFNQIAGRCEDNYSFESFDSIKASIPASALSCSVKPDSPRTNRAMGPDLVTDIYFDEAMVEQSLQNQCQFNYWSALNTKDNESYKIQDQANKKLGTQFHQLNRELSSPAFNDRAAILPAHPEHGSPQQQTEKVQRKVVDQLVEAAMKLAVKQRELQQFEAKHPTGRADFTGEIGPQKANMVAEIAVLENSFIMSEDQEVKNFVQYDIINKIKESFSVGKTPDTMKLKEFFYSDKENSFQTKVVEKKLAAISEQQKKYADIDGKYNDHYGYKASTVQSGIGAKLMSKKVNQVPRFAQVQCELDSKFGKGEKIADTAHSVIIGGVTVAFGGGALIMARLAHIGMTTQRAAKLVQVFSTWANAGISVAEFSRMVVESCREPHFKTQESTTCSRVNSIKENGLVGLIDQEIDHSQCLTDLGLSALAGAFALKTAANARKMKHEQAILNLGIRDRYNSLTASINNNVNLSVAQRKALIKELDNSISSSDMNGFPREAFLAALAKEDSSDLLSALKQINTEVGGTTWLEKIKIWIEKKNLSKKEAEELEACLVDSPTRTTECSTVSENPKT
jgi:hypothetical protein